jgi:hemerythrin superfamily protein
MLLLAILTFSHCSSYADKKEVKDVLEALEKLKVSAETGVMKFKYVELLSDARSKIKILEDSTIKNRCFYNNVLICYALYKDVTDHWGNEELVRAPNEFLNMFMIV